MKRFDVAIIGGGIVGTSVAYFLANRGMRSISLFERSTIAAGASGKTGALLRQHYSNEPEARLAHRGYEIYRGWERIVGGSCGHVPFPIVITVDTRGSYSENIEKMYRNVEFQNRLGIDAQVVTRADLERLQPFADWSDVEVAALEPESGYVDAIQATRSIAYAAEANSVSFFEFEPVREIVVESGKVKGLRTDKGQIACDIIVCAAGSWTEKLLQPIGIPLPLQSLRVQVAILLRPMTLPDDHFVYVDTAAGMFTRPWGAGRSLVGVGGGDQHDGVDPDHYEIRNDTNYAQKAIDAISHRIPNMRHSSFLHGHAGLYDMSPDAHPIIGETSVEGLLVAAGFSGAGFKKGPAVGEALAGYLTGQSLDEVGLAPFALSRFDGETWSELWSPNEYTFSSDFGHGL